MRASTLAKFVLKVLDTQKQFYEARQNQALKSQLLRQCKGMEAKLRKDCAKAIEEDQTPNMFREGMPPDAIPPDDEPSPEGIPDEAGPVELPEF